MDYREIMATFVVLMDIYGCVCIHMCVMYRALLYYVSFSMK